MGDLESCAWRLVFWNSIHLEVASGPFCLLLHSPWPLVFALCLLALFLLSVNLYCWKGLHFSWSNSHLFLLVIVGLIFSFHFWFRDLLRELAKKYEILLICWFLVFYLFLASESLGGAFVSLEISSQFVIFFCLFSFIQAWTFVSLQIKEFQIMGLSINDSVYSSVFFFLTGLHFFHLLLGLLLLGLFFWSCSFQEKNSLFIIILSSETNLFSNLQLFYWHFVEIL